MSRLTYLSPRLVGTKLMNLNNRQTNNRQPKNYVTSRDSSPQQRIHLNGAAQRRYRHLIKKGWHPKSAKLRSLRPLSPSSKVQSEAQRHRGVCERVSSVQVPEDELIFNSSAGSSIPYSPMQSQAAPTQCFRLPVKARLGAPVHRGTSLPAMRGGVSEICEEDESANRNLAILPGEYPTELWSTRQLEAVQQSIINLIRRQDENSIRPSFYGYTFQEGWLLIKCNDKYTANWLKSMDTRLRPWEGASLRVVPETDVPFHREYVGLFPALENTPIGYALDLISDQNVGLVVGDWSVVHRAQNGPIMKLIIAIDSRSAEVLRERGYRLNYGFGQVRFRPK